MISKNIYQATLHLAAFYSLTTEQGQLIAYGVIHPARLSHIEPPQGWEAAPLVVTVYAIADRTAVTEQAKQTAAFAGGAPLLYDHKQPPAPVAAVRPQTNRAVRNTRTGEVYRNASAAAAAIGVTKGSMSNHLSRRKDFERLKGEVFEKVS